MSSLGTVTSEESHLNQLDMFLPLWRRLTFGAVGDAVLRLLISMVVSISARHAEDPGSVPGLQQRWSRTCLIG